MGTARLAGRSGSAPQPPLFLPRNGPTIRKSDREAARREPRHRERAAPIQFSPRFRSDATISNAFKCLLVGDVCDLPSAKRPYRRKKASLSVKILRPLE